MAEGCRDRQWGRGGHLDVPLYYVEIIGCIEMNLRVRYQDCDLFRGDVVSVIRLRALSCRDEEGSDRNAWWGSGQMVSVITESPLSHGHVPCIVAALTW